MGIYFRDTLLIRISRGANNCGQHSLEKNIYFIMRFSPHFQLFYFNDRLEFCEFIEWKIKRINNADLFSQPPLLIFIKGANISGGHCKFLIIYSYEEKLIYILDDLMVSEFFSNTSVLGELFFLKADIKYLLFSLGWNKKLNRFKTSSLQQLVTLHNMPRKTQEWLDALNRANAS